MKILLILSLFAVHGQPQEKQVPMPSIEKCWESAKDFIEAVPVPPGMAAVAAGCLKLSDNPRSAPHEPEGDKDDTE